ncbi:MAG: SIMPL domain-containing protein [Gammaproteobacteria bacterium]|nr:SIMPL domain-containing protein [Gammaproteobacteria bacterium]
MRLTFGSTLHMRRVTALSIAAAALFLAAPPCLANDARETVITLVESTGTGTIQTVPSHAEFWFHKQPKAESLEQALADAEQFGAELQAQFNTHKLRPIATEVSAPAVTSLSEKTAAASAQVTFPLLAFAKSGTGARAFGTLCDTLSNIAKKLNVTLNGPFPETAQKDEIIRQAIALATENAYPPAEAAAEALDSIFYAVDTVQIVKIHWNRTPDSEAAEPNLRRITCTAEIRVVYALTPRS